MVFKHGTKSHIILSELLSLVNERGCVKFAEARDYISKKHPEISKKTIIATIVRIKKFINEGKIENITTPDKGIFCKSIVKINSDSDSKISRIKEEEFYEPLVEYLVSDLEECTQAISLGGNIFKDKWGTPDVIGVYKLPEYIPIKPTPEIISCELKIDKNQLVVAFGQACAYKLFSHKVYLALPRESIKNELTRVESLCLRFGIGLIIFNSNDKNNPNFEIRTRAIKGEPDYYYLNKYIEFLPENLKRKLFK